MPDERVSDDIHVVAQAEVYEGVGRAEIIAVRAFARMDEGKLQIVLRGNLAELFLDESNVFFDLFLSPVDVVGQDRGAGRNGAVDGHANIEMVFVGVLAGVFVWRNDGWATGMFISDPVLLWLMMAIFIGLRFVVLNWWIPIGQTYPGSRLESLRRCRC